MKARGECGPVNGTAAYSFAAIVGAEGKRISASGNSRIFPVQVMRANFVADPVFLCVPEGSGFQTYYIEASPGQALQENTAGRTNADDEIVNLVAGAKALHG
jgi:hypothetical protein